VAWEILPMLEGDPAARSRRPKVVREIMNPRLRVGFVAYLGVLAPATYVGYRWAKSRNRPECLFRLPTLIAYEWYCRKEAGFHNYKTIDQWKRENPGAIEAIQAAQAKQGGASLPRSGGGGMQYEINSRFRSETRSDTRAWA